MNVTPYRLERFIERATRDITVEDAEKRRWLESPCTAAVQARLLDEMHLLFSGMLEAQSWEEYLVLRAGYKQLEGLLGLSDDIETAENYTPRTIVEHVRKEQEDVLNGTAD